LDGGTDVRRIRALTVQRLEAAGDDGHTLQRKKDAVLAIRDLDISPQCKVDSDLMNVAEPSSAGLIALTKLKDGSPCYQLNRLAEVGRVIRESANKRRGGVRHRIPESWRGLLDRRLGPTIPRTKKPKNVHG